MQLQWQVDAGQVEGPVNAARWNLSAVNVDSETEPHKATASSEAIRAGRTVATCQVEILIGKDLALPPDRRAAAEDLFSTKHYLLPHKAVEPHYGLYSYLLFSAPPRDAEEKARYLRTIEACLILMRDVDEYLSRHVRPKSLNVTYIPVLKTPQKAKESDEWARNVLQSYDYATASILLAMVEKGHDNGPYILSTLGSLTPDTPVRLWEDFTGVVPEQVWDRVRFFTYLAAQQRTWTQETVRRLALAVRNLIAIGGKVVPDSIEAADKAIQFEAKATSPRKE